MARTIENTPTSPYAVLGVSRHASDEQIKHAYRNKAKAAHPDAGGSVTAMAAVNAAYHTLSDPDARAAYDGVQAAAAPGRSSYRSEPRSGGQDPAAEPDFEPVNHPRGGQPFHENEAEHIHRSRAAWARSSAWEMLRYSLPAAVAAVIIERVAPTYVPLGWNLFAIGMITFMPVYALLLSILFLTDPALRLVFADLVRGHRTTAHERTSALALVLAFFPLAVLWALVQSV